MRRRTTVVPSHAPAFTLVELILVIAIMAVLVVLSIPSYRYFKRRAEDAACMENLRALHAALSSYMGDHGQVWPQVPASGATADDESGNEQAKWWYETLKPYGPTRHTWVCPSHPNDFATESDEKVYDFSYIPMHFDDTPNIAYKWKMPWVIEYGGFHDGSKANQVMPDGSLRKEDAPGPGGN